MRSKQHAGGASGFTLIEVLLVVAILGILATVVVVNFSGKQQGAMIRATRASIGAVSTAIDMYEVDNGRFPASLQNLLTASGERNWNGPYLRGGLPQDAWGAPLNYAIQGDSSYVVTSAGPDGQFGTDDDLTSHTN